MIVEPGSGLDFHENILELGRRYLGCDREAIRLFGLPGFEEID